MTSNRPVSEMVERLASLPVRTEIINVDTMETGVQNVELPLDLRDDILAALAASSQAPSDARDNCVLGDDCLNRAIPPAVASDATESALFSELVKCGIDQRTADQVAQAVCAAIPSAGGVEEADKLTDAIWGELNTVDTAHEEGDFIATYKELRKAVRAALESTRK